MSNRISKDFSTPPQRTPRDPVKDVLDAIRRAESEGRELTKAQ